MDKELIINKYKSKTLAIESFGSNRKKFVEDFLDVDSMLYELQQLNNHELTLTNEGISFLDEYYGLDKVVDLLLERINEGVDYKYKNRENLLNWLRDKGDIVDI